MIATDRFVLHEVHHHPGPYRGRTAIMRRLASDGLVAATVDGWKLTAKGVGRMNEDFMGHREIDSDLARTLTAERDALQALVAEQCEALAEMVPATELNDARVELIKQAERITKLEDLDDWAANAVYYLEGYLLAIYGERRPVKPIEPCELRDLVNFIFEGGGREP